jgi:hypothetical protein
MIVLIFLLFIYIKFRCLCQFLQKFFLYVSPVSLVLLLNARVTYEINLKIVQLEKAVDANVDAFSWRAQIE